MFNRDLIAYIRNSYKEIDSLRVSIDDKPLKGTLYNLLTPFLAFTNTLDTHNRIISFYTREGSKQQKLLPFYIGISNYYKVYNEIKEDYSEESMDTSKLDSMLSEVEKMFPKSFKYLNKDWRFNGLKVKLDRNNKIHLSLESIERHPNKIAPTLQNILSTLSRAKSINTKEILVKVDGLQLYLNEFINSNKKFFELDKIKGESNSEVDIKDIVKLGTKLNVKPSSGVLLFTSKAKYRQLLKDIQIGDLAITEQFPIVEIKISRDNLFSIKSEGVDNVEPIIYYCSSEYYLGWEVILEELNLNHVNTLIFDDFDFIIKKESRNDFADFKDFTEELKVAQSNSVIKDVYFLQKDYHFNYNSILENFGLETYPWLINHKERVSLNSRGVIEKSSFTTLPVTNSCHHDYWSIFKMLSRQLTEEISSTNDINYSSELLNVVKTGYQIFDRLNSFFDSSLIKIDYGNYIEKLTELVSRINYTSYKNKVEDLSKLIDNRFFFQSKVSVIINVIKRLELKGEILIISKNDNKSDAKNAKETILNETGLDSIFLHLDDTAYLNTRKYKYVFFLTYSGKITKSLFLTKYCKKQFVILNSKMELGYFKYCFSKFTPVISDLSDFDNKLLLLNLENQEYLVDNNKIEFNVDDYIDHTYDIANFDEETEVDKDEIVEESNVEDVDSIDENEFDFSFVINKIIRNNNFKLNEGSSISGNSANTLLLFEDGYLRVPQTKFFYLLNDGSETGSDIKKRASELKLNDKIFVMSRFNDDFNELLNYLKDKYKKLNKYHEASSSWRTDLISKYEELGGYITSLNRFLSSNDIHVTNPTVDRWVTGLTIYPDCLEKLIDLFKKDEFSQTSGFEKEEILKATDWVAKFRTKLHKQIYLYHVYKNHGMTHQIDELELKNIIERLNEVVSVKEILMIQQE
ncbi:hypothetical protein JM84_3060 [Dokdonia sp. Hel_I_63]|uniref:hypothetical protein n=1 Tax=Dokdonia sp. Hel_I_63 TaxID=1249996 RepID=UPI00119A7CF9|nr:hypothetical protein [Dokdonia sp. Hel_I_63]TVZ24101.1 hypothetical protein JM84_3060 [Dokdonia sp. Hel_I_63]